MKTIKLGDFLSDTDIARAATLRDARRICELIIQPRLKEIEAKLGQECDAMYLAYAVEYALGVAFD